MKHELGPKIQRILRGNTHCNFFFFLFWLSPAACGLLVSQPEVEPMPSVLEAQNLNHWTAREVSVTLFNLQCLPSLRCWRGHLSTLLLNLIGLCLLQQMEYSRSDAKPEKATLSLPSSLEYSWIPETPCKKMNYPEATVLWVSPSHMERLHVSTPGQQPQLNAAFESSLLRYQLFPWRNLHMISQS